MPGCAPFISRREDRVARKGRFELFADNATVRCSWRIPKLLPAASRPRLGKNSTPHTRPSPTPRPPAPPAPCGFALRPHDRRRRLRPDAECAGPVDLGAVDGDAVTRHTQCPTSPRSWFAHDSPLEQSGFELPVQRAVEERCRNDKLRSRAMVQWLVWGALPCPLRSRWDRDFEIHFAPAESRANFPSPHRASQLRTAGTTHRRPAAAHRQKFTANA